MRGIVGAWPYLALVLGATGWGFALLLYLHLRRWVAHLRGTRIAVAYKRRVELDAPLHDWLDWGLMLEGDGASKGRVVYRHGQTSVAILKPGQAVAEVVSQT